MFSFTVVSELVQSWVLLCWGPLADRSDPSTEGNTSVRELVSKFLECLSLKVTGWFVLLLVTSLELGSRRLLALHSVIHLCSVHCWG